MYMSENTPPSTTIAPHVCYRHANRETRVSCGRCGKYLCPDCVRHGPVGVRCSDCLRTPRLILPLENFQRSRTGGIISAACWIILMLAVGWLLNNARFDDHAGFSLLTQATPNLLLSLLAGITTGRVIWLLAGRRSSFASARFAALLGLLIPLFATLLLAAPHITSLISDIAFLPRVLLACVFSTGSSWLLATELYHGN